MVDFPHDLKKEGVSTEEAFPVRVVPPRRARIHFDYILPRGRLMPLERKKMSMDAIERVHEQHWTVDYISPEDLARLEKARRDYVSVRARELWADSKDARERLKKARKAIKEASEDDLANPDDMLQEHMRVVDTTDVPTKDDCLANARAEYQQKYGVVQ